jgi:hypothetical protein
MNRTQIHSMKHNISNMADNLAGNAGAIADNLADEAQNTAGRVATQLADWTENHGHQVAGLLSVSGRRMRSMVLARPLFCLTLVAGASALAAYLLTRRYATAVQTNHADGAHDKEMQRTSTQANT